MAFIVARFRCGGHTATRRGARATDSRFPTRRALGLGGFVVPALPARGAVDLGADMKRWGVHLGLGRLRAHDRHSHHRSGNPTWAGWSAQAPVLLVVPELWQVAAALQNDYGQRGGEDQAGARRCVGVLPRSPVARNPHPGCRGVRPRRPWWCSSHRARGWACTPFPEKQFDDRITSLLEGRFESIDDTPVTGVSTRIMTCPACPSAPDLHKLPPILEITGEIGRGSTFPAPRPTTSERRRHGKSGCSPVRSSADLRGDGAVMFLFQGHRGDVRPRNRDARALDGPASPTLVEPSSRPSFQVAMA